MFNELRSDLVLLYELKQACANCEYELQMLRHRHEALARAGVLGGPATPASGPAPASAESAVSEPGLGPDATKDTIIDVVGAPLTPNSVRAWTGWEHERPLHVSSTRARTGSAPSSRAAMEIVTLGGSETG